MFSKKNLPKLLEKLNPFIEERDYFNAGIIAESYGYLDLAKVYYNLSVQKLKDEINLHVSEKEIKFQVNAQKALSKRKFYGRYAPLEDTTLKEPNYQCYDIVQDLDNGFKKN